MYATIELGYPNTFLDCFKRDVDFVQFAAWECDGSIEILGYRGVSVDTTVTYIGDYSTDPSNADYEATTTVTMEYDLTYVDDCPTCSDFFSTNLGISCDCSEGTYTSWYCDTEPAPADGYCCD
jgi:hypothetical protein